MQEDANRGKPLKIVQFTDTHFFGTTDGRLMGVDTANTFAQVSQLAAHNAGTPDFYLLTGDLSQDETEDSYIRLAEAVKGFGAPAYYLPGNHDARPLMHKAFGEIGGPFRPERSFSAKPWHIVLLDTQLEGEVGGHLAEDELARLDQELSAHFEDHVLVTMHHHPVPIGSTWIDQIKVDNGDQFLKVIDAHPNVRAVLWGHVHQEFEMDRKGVRFMGTPSTCVQFKPQSSGFAVDALMAPGYRWLQLNPDGTVDTKVGRVSQLAAGLDIASLGY